MLDSAGVGQQCRECEQFGRRGADRHHGGIRLTTSLEPDCFCVVRAPVEFVLMPNVPHGQPIRTGSFDQPMVLLGLGQPFAHVADHRLSLRSSQQIGSARLPLNAGRIIRANDANAAVWAEILRYRPAQKTVNHMFDLFFGHLFVLSRELSV